MRLKLVPDNTEINFFSKIRYSLFISVSFLIISILAYFIFGLNYGIDFRGGTLLMIKSEKATSISDYRSVLREINVGDFSVTEISSPASKISGGIIGDEAPIVLVRIEQADNEDSVQNDLIIAVKSKLEVKFPGIVFLQTDSVGAKVSKELVRKGVISVLFAVAAVLFYIWIRFEWQFALGAVVALIHDVIITLGIFAILSLEFNLSIIAALLTIVGYSLNDTVIVFDRIRENLKRFKSKPLVELLNLSVNETLSRTLMTSVTTLLALASLYFLGGDVLRGFTFAMIWGVLIGTFSSIFVAAPILIMFGVKRDWSKPDGEAGTQFSQQKIK